MFALYVTRGSRGKSEMNLRQALYIKTIAEEGGISAAAKRLYISQPSLSQMLNLIEKELGVILFERNRQDFRPTYAGECYLKAANIILNTNEILESELQDFRNERSGKLRLGISRHRGEYLLPLVLHPFVQEYPNVHLELTESGSGTLVEKVSQGEIDLALATTEPTYQDLDYQLVEREAIGILTGPGSPLSETVPKWTPVPFADHADWKFVALKHGHNMRVIHDNLFRHAGVEPQIILETDGMEVARSLAEQCGFYTLSSDISLKDDAFFYPLSDFTNTRHFYACTRKDYHQPQYIRVFISEVQKNLGGHPTRLQ